MSRISALVHRSLIPQSIEPAAVGLPTLVNFQELNADEVFGTHRSTAKRQLFSGERDFGEPQVDFCKAPVATLGTYAVVSTDLPLHPGRYVPDGPRARAADDLHVRRAHRSRRGPLPPASPHSGDHPLPPPDSGGESSEAPLTRSQRGRQTYPEPGGELSQNPLLR